MPTYNTTFSPEYRTIAPVVAGPSARMRFNSPAVLVSALMLASAPPIPLICEAGIGDSWAEAH